MKRKSDELGVPSSVITRDITSDKKRATAFFLISDGISINGNWTLASLIK